MHCSLRLIVQTLVFSRSYLHRQVSPPETLVVKGGTTWARNGRQFGPKAANSKHKLSGSFTCRKYATWDKRFYFPSEGRPAEDFFALNNPTASVGFEPKASTLSLDHRSRSDIDELYLLKDIQAENVDWDHLFRKMTQSRTFIVLVKWCTVAH